MNILLTGGAGYIGSHTAVSLIEHGYKVIVMDNFSNSSPGVIRRIEEITGKNIIVHNADIRDEGAVNTILTSESIDAVIHMAGLKAVGESVEKPLDYYENNVTGSIVLLRVMQKHSIKKFIFSSSATVYGSAPYPYTESDQTGVGITSPYGKTKYMVEEIMKDLAISDSSCAYMSLRYFNPVGAHESGLIGEDPTDQPNNLMPYIAQVAVGRRPSLRIWGDDYDTPDGTGVRDFIHVMDVAEGHVAALDKLQPGFDAINLGSGKGVSVYEMLHAFEKASGRTIPYTVEPRREGDLPEYYANAEKAKRILSWSVQRTPLAMCEDTWRWQSQNPNGYTS